MSTTRQLSGAVAVLGLAMFLWSCGGAERDSTPDESSHPVATAQGAGQEQGPASKLEGSTAGRRAGQRKGSRPDRSARRTARPQASEESANTKRVSGVLQRVVKELSSGDGGSGKSADGKSGPARHTVERILSQARKEGVGVIEHGGADETAGSGAGKGAPAPGTPSEAIAQILRAARNQQP